MVSLLLLIPGMASETTSQRKLTKLVADHVLRHVHGGKALAGVHEEGYAHEIGDDHRGAAPGLDRLAVAALKLGVNLVEKRLTDEGSFFEGTSHCM